MLFSPEVGGSQQSWSPGGLRLRWCEVPDLCQVSQLLQHTTIFRYVQHPAVSYYDTSQFLAASSKADLCGTRHLPLLGNRTEGGFTGFREYCMLSKSDTAIMCPALILKGKNRQVKRMNKRFSKALDKKKKKRTFTKQRNHIR